MRPYWAIIWDSFYQAFVSWLLWIVLGSTALVLAVFAGITYRNELNTQLTFEEVRDWRELAARLVREHGGGKPAPGKHLYNLLSPDVQQAAEILARPAATGAKPHEEFTLAMALARELSRLLARDEFFNAEAFARVKVSAEGRDLLERNDLAPAEVARRNRLLLEGAYAEMVRPSSRYGAQFYFFTWKLGEPLPLRHDQIVDTVEKTVYFMLVWFVSIIGIMVAVVLTSWLIPFMFEEGSIVVLLSKPVSRSLLFLAKFFGACAFTLISTSFFILGLYAIVGARLGVWLPNMLWCIPIFLFVFAIYFSVSAVCGLMSRSTIVGTVLSIVGVFVFWFLCFLVGTAKTGLETTFLHRLRLVKILPAGERLFAVNEVGQVFRWDTVTADWQMILVNDKRPFAEMPAYLQPPQGVLGPVFDSSRKQLLTLSDPNSGFSMPGFETGFAVGQEEQNFRYVPGVSAPSGVLDLFTNAQGELLVVSRGGVQRLKTASAVPAPAAGLLSKLLPWGGTKGPWEELGPPDLFIHEPASVALNAQTQDIAIYSQGQIQVLRRTPAGKYERGPEYTLAGDVQPGMLAMGGNTVLLALANGTVHSFAAQTLEPMWEWSPEGKNQPRFVTAAPDGNWFTVLFHNGRLWRYNATQEEFSLPNVRGQGHISAAAFTPENRLLLADRTARVTGYEMNSLAREIEYSPPLSTLDQVYYWVIWPTYYLLPKPGELNNTVNFVLTQQETEAATLRANSLQAAQIKRDPWAPIPSSAVFIVVLLAYGCWKIERMEF